MPSLAPFGADITERTARDILSAIYDSAIIKDVLQRQYIQVTLSILEEDVRFRELRSLQQLRDAFDRIVITLDPYTAGTTEEGIRIVNALDWLLNPDEHRA